MAHYKNRKPKSYKGCCGMCCLQTTDGRRNHRIPSMQEQRAPEVPHRSDAEAELASRHECGHVCWCDDCEPVIDGPDLADPMGFAPDVRVPVLRVA